MVQMFRKGEFFGCAKRCRCSDGCGRLFLSSVPMKVIARLDGSGWGEGDKESQVGLAVIKGMCHTWLIIIFKMPITICLC